MIFLHFFMTICTYFVNFKKLLLRENLSLEGAKRGGLYAK